MNFISKYFSSLIFHRAHLDTKPVHSDDSDDEAPEGGDYTVYECPGLAPVSWCNHLHYLNWEHIYSRRVKWKCEIHSLLNKILHCSHHQQARIRQWIVIFLNYQHHHLRKNSHLNIIHHLQYSQQFPHSDWSSLFCRFLLSTSIDSQKCIWRKASFTNHYFCLWIVMRSDLFFPWLTQ